MNTTAARRCGIAALGLFALAGAATAQAPAGEPGGDLGGERAGEPTDRPKLGAFVSETAGLATPADAVWNAKGELFVLEADRDRIVVRAPDGTPKRTIGSTGDGPGQFHDPRALEFGPDGRLYVADTGNHRIQVFDGPWQELVLSFGTFGSGLGDLAAPVGIAVFGNQVFVAEALNHRVQVFDHEGRAVRTLGTPGSGPGELRRPSDVAVDPDGNLYVTEAWNHRVQKFDLAGKSLATWGDFGPHPGFFATPSGITYHAGQLFVADRDNHRIQVFDPAGQLLYAWGLHAIRPRESAGKLHYPNRVALSDTVEHGPRAAVVEGFENRLQFFGPTVDGAEPPAAGSLDRSVSAHYGGAVDSAGGWMTLVEPTRPAALIWDDGTNVAGLEPISVSRVSAWGSGFGQFRMPTDAAVELERSRLWVCDPGNQRLDAWRIDRDEGPIKYQPDLLRLAFSIDLAELACAFEHYGALEASAIEIGHGGWVEDSVLVADARSRSVVEIGTAAAPPESILDLEAGTLAAWRRWPDERQEPLLEATDLALSPDGAWLYVADRVAGCVRAFPRDASPGDMPSDSPPSFEPFEFRGSADEPLLRPAGICVDAQGSVYVTDAARHRVSKFDASGKHLADWGREGLGAREFYKPRGIAVRSDGNLVVLDHGNHRGQILSPEGEFLHVFGSLLFIEPARR